jgi:inner membrane protein
MSQVKGANVMTKNTHLLVGAAVTIPFISWSNALIIPVALIGSIVPDIDFKFGIKHRTITHSLMCLLITSMAFLSVDVSLGILWLVNYSLHLFLDSLTLMGVPLFYPYKKYYGFKICKTRGSLDYGLSLIALTFIMKYLN